MSEPLTSRTGTGVGFGRLIVFLYGVLAFAGLGRSSFELTTKFSEAPVPYSLSALAALIYCVATFALGTDRRRLAMVTVSIELVFVLVVGVTTTFWSDAFPEKTIWSDFGIGYGFFPLVLPMVGLWWIWRQGSRRAEQPTG
ncbi:MAG: hypothetical protein JWR35_2727 [Marmoricola sp.]|jgi:hypothetical protein|nr:hypothetical protein [Marmoricola sp.]